MAQSGTQGQPVSRRDLEARREQLYYELGERGDRVAEGSASLARSLRTDDLDFQDVEELRGVLDELNEKLDEAERIAEIGQ